MTRTHLLARLTVLRFNTPIITLPRGEQREGRGGLAPSHILVLSEDRECKRQRPLHNTWLNMNVFSFVSPVFTTKHKFKDASKRPHQVGLNTVTQA